MADQSPKSTRKKSCAHCGDKCIGDYPTEGEHDFCCQGCRMVWKILHDHKLSSYYTVDNIPGISARNKKKVDYSFLDNDDIKSKLISFSVEHQETVFLNLPQIHCSACVWLLENLQKLNEGILRSRVDFLKKQAVIVYDSRICSLKELVILLDRIGYQPTLQLNDVNQKVGQRQDKQLLYKIGLAGFCFGNIMLLSFPEYLGYSRESFMGYLGYINIALALPVLFYSGREYLLSAWISVKGKDLGIDLPIALGMLTLFIRSVFEIISESGAGYLDSFTGFVFFLLIGRWFQNYTYSSISFDRDFRSFFPISVKYRMDAKWIDRGIDQLRPDDIILIKAQEIIPCDGVLISGDALIDYSFVTGESEPISIAENGTIAAGGKQLIGPIQVRISKALDQSRLTQLWNNEIFSKKPESTTLIILNVIGKYFTVAILVVGLLTLLYWLIIDSSLAYISFSAVLIIACPCVLALSIPFLYGNALRLLTRSKIFVKNTETLFRLSKIDDIVFDKTGTLTDSTRLHPVYDGITLSEEEMSWIKSSCSYSNHPLSLSIAQSIDDVLLCEPSEVEEVVGQGIKARFGNTFVKIGSYPFMDSVPRPQLRQDYNYQTVFIRINNEIKGCYKFKSHVRPCLKNVIGNLGASYDYSILTGDIAIRNKSIFHIFPDASQFYFNQSPIDKLDYIKKNQDRGRKILMIGDGLNDAGALKQSDVGIVISSTSNNFTPSSDIIISDDSFTYLYNLLRYAQQLRMVLLGAFLLALLYNLVGLAFAVSGNLSPVVAAILMPLSSITIVAYGVSMSVLFYHRNFNDKMG